ncbi:FG-GAP-like repeat-containing protein [Lysobacter solisilvae (ex Woo and Kim 2020)]|uniref:VCBS repeat-containing protein n=1 Tax=Agrilutibacter terrestris TaxID=2865112 RepID=A0A7H0FZE7_9GAMM|nr:FG-GAP-like repeat-containing protein [Lysobacter terrestris]QNP41413.1 VCBS repeat-containing protein [Lysobacter terrestris]
MRAFLFTVAALLGFGLLLSVDRPGTLKRGTPHPQAVESLNAVGSAGMRAATSAIASYPDHGELLSYDDERKTIHSGASTWQPVQISEQHALRAIVEGEMTVRAPNGEIIRLRYERHVEHPDGNWTWVGRQDGSAPGTETLLTFGEKAVFGNIRQGKADLSITTEAGSTWLVETDYSRVDHNKIATNDGDFLVASGMQQSMATGTPNILQGTSDPAPVARVSAAAAVAAAALTPTTVDIAMGFTTGFATRLGGESQARTRLHFLVDTANQAYLASGITAQIRLVHAVQVSYPDSTHNDSALFDLTGVDCTEATNGAHYRSSARFDCTARAQPAALQPLVSARWAYGADLLVLVRKFETSSASCGVAWLLGGGQSAINSSSTAFGTAVVNDTSGDMFPDNGVTCPDVHLAHELGHNMGQQHDVVSASGSDDSDNNGNLLDPEEYGRHPYSFGYSTDGTPADIATIMSNRREGQTRYRVFANPLITSCGGAPCGIADQADNARSMMEVMPIIAGFRATVISSTSVHARDDINGDGKSDLLFRNSQIGSDNFIVWLMNGTQRSGGWTTTMAASYRVAATSDVSGDGKLDIVWTSSNSDVRIWLGTGTSFTPAFPAIVGNAAGLGAFVGAGDVNGDGKSDLLFRNDQLGSNNFTVWLMNGTQRTGSWATTMATSYRVGATGDLNGDGKIDIVWTSGNNDVRVWLGTGTSFTPTFPAIVGNASGSGALVGAGDVNGDGKADLLFRNGQISNNNFTVWLMNGTQRTGSWTASMATSYSVATTGDHNGDGKLDVVWTSANRDVRIWLGTGTSFTPAFPAIAGTYPTGSWTIVKGGL